LKAFLAELALEDLLFDGAGSEETICKASLLLSVSPATSCSLLVYCRVPIRVEEYEPWSASERMLIASYVKNV
jgi:hypothetical protein